MKEQNEKFSFAFVDCDKKGYQQYYQLLFGGEEGEGGQGGLLTEGGVAVFDNVLWKGMVAEVEVSFCVVVIFVINLVLRN